ncbi:MAG: hypothetical protein WAQ05_23885 [Rubrivivax sp.]
MRQAVGSALQWIRDMVSNWWRGNTAAPGVATSGSGEALLDRVIDGELLATHVLQHGMDVAAADVLLLLAARERFVQWRNDAVERELFVAALLRVSRASGCSAAELHAMRNRLARLWPQLGDARRLLDFASARGVEVKADVARPILDAVHAAQGGDLSADNELAYLVAYQQLAARMAPVTAATLSASKTCLPRLADLLLQPQVFLKDLRNMTLGRFAHFILFSVVLAATGMAIAYQSTGEAALARFQALGQRLQAMPGDERKLLTLQRERQGAYFALQQRKDARPDELLAADLRLQESMADVRDLDRVRQALGDERSQLLASLSAWAARPCFAVLLQWLCKPGAGGVAVDEDRVFDAQMVLRRLDTLVLPMVLGLLGAYAFVLRSISQDVRQFAFEEYSVLHHVVRLSLGAVAGVAAGWLLKPEQVGLLNSVPAWVLAFVAGYAIELVFTFLDRLVSGFTSKAQPGG